MKGIVDELRLDDLGKIVVVEVKTRRSNSLPSDAQRRTAELQVACLACRLRVIEEIGLLRCAQAHGQT